MIFGPKRTYSAPFIRRAIVDIKSLNVPAGACIDHFLTMLSEWIDSPERESQAAHLPLHLFEIDTSDLSDEQAEIEERRHNERFRNLYRQLFGDRARADRQYIRQEVQQEWALFISIFALIYPDKVKLWSSPDVDQWREAMDTKRYLRAHGRRAHTRATHGSTWAGSHPHPAPSSPLDSQSGS